MIPTANLSFCFPSDSCLRTFIMHALCQWPRPRPLQRGFTISICRRMRYSQVVSAEEDRRAVFAIAVTLSDQIERLSDQLVIQIRPYKPLRSFTKLGPLARNGQARLAGSQLRRKL